MKKMLITFAMMLMGICAFAQMPNPLPINGDVRHGKLDNGLSYYILHNETPKGVANFYIAQKVGSTLETSEQLGLAHFLEHMAFNGTTHYPGKSMLNYLQTKGLRFGADINAYTAFDETVYNIDNVPTSDKALMDSVLLVLYDWSGSILLEEDEINAERGVIQEEWRMRNDATTRMYTQMLPQIYEEPEYQRMPIGTMDVVMNFPPQAIRDYYKKWYRPDQQGIVIVGDFDADEMEQKVKALFADIPMPENAAERTYPTVSINQQPIYFGFEDPEQRNAMITTSFKMEKFPFEYRNTDAAYLMDMIKNVISQLINNRLNEYALEPDCKYAYAGVRFGEFYVSKTIDSFNVIVLPKGNNMLEAYGDAMAVVARACKTGFTDSELERVTSEIKAGYERLYNERNKQETGTLANELIRLFIDNEPAPGIEMEYEMVNQFLTLIPVQQYNMVAAEIMQPVGQVIVIAQPKTETSEPLPSKEAVIETLETALNGNYEAYVDEVITEPLIAQLPAKGSVVASEDSELYGGKVLTLSNGVKVIVKNTDFSADEIVFTAFRKGGKESYSTDLAADVLMMEDAYEMSKMGPFDTKMLARYLAGKKVSCNYSLGSTTNGINGSSTVKDLPTLMEIIYASFTALSPDEQTAKVQVEQARSVLANLENNPNFAFQRAVSQTMYGNNPLMAQVSVATLDNFNYLNSLDLVKKSFANAADYTFEFVGNVDLDTLIPLLEQYVASLPSNGVASVPEKVTNIDLVSGKVVNEFEQPMDTPSTMFVYNYNGVADRNVKNAICADIMGSILSNIFTETLREEEGGAYSPYAYGDYNYVLGKWNLIAVVQTNADQQARMLERANIEALKLMKEGASAEQFGKVKSAALNQYKIDIEKNNNWIAMIRNCELGNNVITGYAETLEGLTVEDLNTWMKDLWNGENFIEVLMVGVPANK